MKMIATMAVLALQGVGQERLSPEVARAEKTLSEKPDDAAANLTLGVYHAGLADWDRAFDHLKKSKNTTIGKLVEREAAVKADNAFDLVEVGDEWAKATAKLRGTKTLARDRALFWYAAAWAAKLDIVWKEKLREKAKRLQGFPSPEAVRLRKSAGKADRWNGFNDSTYSYLDASFAYDGRFSAKLLSTGKEKEEWYAFLATEAFAPPPAGTELAISAWIYTSQTDRDGYMAVRYFGADGKLLSQEGIVIDPDFPFWKKYALRTRVPEGAKRMDIPFLHKSVAGATWIDKVSVSDGKEEFVKNGSLEMPR